MGNFMKSATMRNVILLALVVIGIALAPIKLSEYWQHVMIVGMYYVIMAASWNLLAGYTGQFSQIGRASCRERV